MNDARSKQALYLAKQPQSSRLGIGSGRAIVWLVGTVVVLGGAIWLLFSLF